MKYQDFLENKSSIHHSHGHKCLADLSDAFHYQKPVVEWACEKGRAAIFQDCGLGKSYEQLAWSDSVHRKTNGKILIVAPLSVASQTVKEGSKFGFDVNRCRENDQIKPGINITNYEILSHFDCSQFDGIVLDESSVLKNYSGKIRNDIISFFNQTPYKLACTATPAPNDMMEIGNHSEFLGVMSRTEMLATYFVHDGGETSKWRLKGHAPKAFWKWLASWALMMKKPSNIGFSDDGFELPKLNVNYHFVEFGTPDNGELFKSMAVGLNEQRVVRRDSILARMEKAIEIINDEQWLIWCDLNNESSALSKAIPNSVEVTGSDKPEKKEAAIEGFLNGSITNLISKPRIFGYGLNIQHCHNMMFFGLSHSYEAMYQAIRRCWRYGQKHPVNVHIIVTDVERSIVENIQRKHEQAETMSIEMIKQMADFTKNEISKTTKQVSEYNATRQIKLPSWIKGE